MYNRIMLKVHYTSLFSEEDLNKALEEGLVIKRKHPNHSIWVYNYSAVAQWKWKWDAVTINCRGLVLDYAGYIVARSFPKFFSYEQLDGKLPEGNYTVEEKLDGSLLFACNYKGSLVLGTRGSFESEQALASIKFVPVGFLPKEGETWVFETVGNFNRIVVKYNFEGLVLLGILDKNGNRIQREHSFRAPKVYTFSNLEEVLNFNEPNAEGFVLHYENGELIKIKTETYRALHKLITGVSERTVWEAMKNNALNEMLEGVPDEFYDWVEEVRSDLQAKYDEIEKEAKEFFVDLGDRKTNAIHYQGFKYPSILFNMLDGTDYSNRIWKEVEPTVISVFKMIWA